MSSETEPAYAMLELAGEVIRFSEDVTMRVIPGHYENNMPDGGIVFDQQRHKFIFQTTVAECVQAGLLTTSFELIQSAAVCLYEFPVYTQDSEGTASSPVYYPIRILEALPDFSGWVRLVAEHTYDRTEYITTTLAGTHSYPG